MSARKKYRVIIRCSIDKDDGSAIRNNVLKKHLKVAGITNNKKTGAWESQESDIVTAHKQLGIVLEELAQISADPNHKASLDHLWIYIDKA